jgi:hypothetical protein
MLGYGWYKMNQKPLILYAQVVEQEELIEVNEGNPSNKSI